VGPPEPPCRGRLQTTASCAGTTAGVVNVEEKAPRRCQVRAGKANESEPLMTRREIHITMSKPGRLNGPGRSLGDVLPTAQAASGVEAVRARFRLLCGTWEAATPIQPPAGSSPVRKARGRSSSGRTARARVPMRGMQ